MKSASNRRQRGQSRQNVTIVQFLSASLWLLLLPHTSHQLQLGSAWYKALSCSEGFLYLTHDPFGKMRKAAEGRGHLLGKPAIKPAHLVLNMTVPVYAEY